MIYSQRQPLERARIVATNLEKIRKTLGISHKEWANRLELTPSEYERYYFNDFTRLQVNSVIKALDSINVAIDAIMEPDAIDLKVLSHRQAKDELSIPEKYTIAAHSKIRSLVQTLDFIERRFSSNLRAHALKRFQITEAALLDSDRPVNIKLLEDFCGYFGLVGVDQAHFIDLGVYIASSLKPAFAPYLTGIDSMPKLWEMIIEEVPIFFEKNCDYRIMKLSDDECTIESISNRGVADQLKVKEVGVPEICTYREGVAMALPGYLGLSHSAVKHTKCVHKGDEACIYEIDYSQAKPDRHIRRLF